jgi:hypothetical protein
LTTKSEFLALHLSAGNPNCNCPPAACSKSKPSATLTSSDFFTRVCSDSALSFSFWESDTHTFNGLPFLAGLRDFAFLTISSHVYTHIDSVCRHVYTLLSTLRSRKNFEVGRGGCFPGYLVPDIRSHGRVRRLLVIEGAFRFFCRSYRLRIGGRVILRTG